MRKRPEWKGLRVGGEGDVRKQLALIRDEIAAEVARDIREQYTIGYHSTKPASQGGFRMVHVEARAKGYGKLLVRTRTGYYPNSKRASAVAPASPNGSPSASN